MEEKKEGLVSNELNCEILKIEFINYRDAKKTDVKNHQTVYVKAEYAKAHPNYTKMNTLEWFKETEIQKFMHNPNGPAVIDHKNNLNTYFLDGNVILPGTEEYNKIKHNETFSNKFDELTTK